MEPATILDYRTPGRGDDASLPPMLIWSRVACFLGAIVLPAVCFWAAGVSRFPLAPRYQAKPQWKALLTLIPDPAISWPFFPLLAYAMTSAAAVIAFPRTAGRHYFVRFGLLTGIVLAMQYVAIYAVAFDASAPFLGYLAGTFAGLAILTGLARLIPARYRTLTVSIVAVFPLAVLSLLFGWRRVALGYLFVFALAPAITCFTFMALTDVARHTEPPTPGPSRRARTIWMVSWLAAWAAAWKGSLALAAAKYATLPTAAPDCYIATAAARGHARIVGAETALTSTGTTFRANAQLRRLKRFEILLRLVAPAIHRRLRAFYDFAGPPLARRLRHPLAADVAYVLLKPAEWVFGGAASLLLPVAVYPKPGAIRLPTDSPSSRSDACRRSSSSRPKQGTPASDASASR
jgi:hypothetical protein